MNTAKPAPSPLVAAAQAFEDDLTSLEEVARELERASLTSHKTLQRAGRMLGDTAELQERLVGRLAELVRAIDATRGRQDDALQRILAESQRVKARNDEFRSIMERFGALGERAKEVSGPVAAITAQKDAGASPAELLASLDVVSKLSDELATEAAEVGKLATAGDWPELARDVDALRQSMLAARNKVTLAQRQVASRAPS
jgi:chromosome segregation ATPase